MASLTGTEVDDLLEGTEAEDQILGLVGNDVVLGSDGDDLLSGNQGNDRLFGGPGEDTIYGGQDNDLIQAGEDEDLIFGDRGNDRIWGDGGDDTIFGGLGADILYGNTGTDELYGNQSDDTIYGGQDNDTLWGGTGDDFLSGDLGNDLLFGDQGTNTLTGGAGRDIFFLQKKFANPTAETANIINDFTKGEDIIGLEQDLTFGELNISQGVGQFQNDTVIRDKNTGSFFAILKNVTSSTLSAADFGSDLSDSDIDDITDDDNNPANDPPTFNFAQGNYNYNEGIGGPFVSVTVNRSGDTSTIVTVDYNSKDGTAKAGADYDRVSGSLVFNPGETSDSFLVPIRDDLIYEGEEFFNIELISTFGGARLGELSTAFVTILDDETFPAPTFKQSNFTVGEAIGNATITLTLNNISDVPLVVNYATSDGTATAGNDYQGTSGSLQFLPGQQELTFTVPIINDSTGEPNETINLSLTSSISGDSLDTATLTITDDDGGAPAMQSQNRLPNFAIVESTWEAVATPSNLGADVAPLVAVTPDSDLSLVIGNLSFES